MNLPDSFYIALCMTILLVGAVYWVWTQIQYVQRKVNVLENIVYELKTLCSRPPEGGPIAPTNYPPAPSSVLGEDEDLLHETLAAEVVAPYATIEEMDSVVHAPRTVAFTEVSAEAVEAVDAMVAADAEVTTFEAAADAADAADATAEVVAADAMAAEPVVPDFSEPVFDMGHYVVEGSATAAADLQPGGVGSGIVPPSLQSSLEGMTLKELRRLAQQKSISGANEMKKRELIDAIRAIPIDSFLE